MRRPEFERWREEYRKARVARRIVEVFHLDNGCSLLADVTLPAYIAAGRVNGKPAQRDPLTRPLWLRRQEPRQLRLI